jgi:hypothetical protein
MSERDIGLEILEGIRDIKAYKAGVKVLRTHRLKESAPPQVIRSKLHLPLSTWLLGYLPMALYHNPRMEGLSLPEIQSIG